MRYGIPFFREFTLTYQHKRWSGASVASRVAVLVTIAFVYTVAGKLGLTLAEVHPSATAVWPPTGIALAATLLVGYAAWPAIFLGAFVTNVTTFGTVWTSLGIAAGNTLEALIGAVLVNRYADGSRAFARAGNVFRFAVLSGFISTMVSATIGVTALAAGGLADPVSFRSIWFTWWLGDMGGALLVAPLIILWATAPRVRYATREIAELFLAACALLLTGFVAFGGFPEFFGVDYHLAFLVLPPLMWVAIRFGSREVATAMLVVAGVSIWSIHADRGLFISRDHTASLVLLQLFFAIVAVSKLIFAALVHEERQAREALSARERRFRSLIEKSSDGVMLVDRIGTVVYASPSVERLLGYSPEELVGSDGFRLVHGEDQRDARNTLAELVASPSATRSLELRVVRKDEVIRWVEATGTNLLLNPAVAAIVVNFRDITGLKEFEKAKGEFISVASRRLHAPLAHMSAYLPSLFSRKGSFAPIDRRYVEEINRAVTTMNAVVDDLVKASRIELGTLQVHPQPIEIRKAVHEALRECAARIQKKEIALDTHLTPGRVRISVDRVILASVLHTLLSRAIAHIPPKARLIVAITASSAALMIRISGAGESMPAVAGSDKLQKFFEVEAESREHPTESALELFVVRSLVNRMGGDLLVEASDGAEGGASVAVTLPRHARVKSEK